jgi:hypothetical protein
MLISILPFIYMCYFYFSVKKKYNKDISFDITYGMRCYSCKSEISNLEAAGGVLKLCDSCERDEQINKVFGRRSSVKLKKLLVSDKYVRLILTFSLPMIFFMALDILDIFFITDNIRIFFILGQLSQLGFWIIWIKRWKYTAIKNPNLRIGVSNLLCND